MTNITLRNDNKHPNINRLLSLLRRTFQITSLVIFELKTRERKTFDVSY